MAPDKPVALAVVIGAHGVTGEVRLKLFAEGLDSVKAHKSFNSGALSLTSLRPNKDGAIARFAEITDRNAAEAARGTELTVPRSALPPLAEDEFYHIDLIGLPVVSAAGDAIGNVCAVENFGAGEIIEIAQPAGGKFMVPVSACEWLETHMVLSDDFLP